jgi:16S rRNA (adenine1518-N6/adenine1519-N6)-dimethyltransferase
LDSLRRQLKKFQIRPKKRLGQHFVIDSRVLRRIVETADLQPDDLVLEIGAGNGSLTALLAQSAKKVYALEIDPNLIPILQSQFSGGENVEIVSIDALEFDFAGLSRQWGRKLKVVANLPYEISTPILFRFFGNRESFSLLVLMLQKEVARRLVASPGSKEYGPLSLWTRLYTDARLAFFVPPGAFYPAPKVESAVVRFEFLPQPRIPVDDEEALRKVIRSAFTYRRKMLANALRLGDFPLIPLEKIQGTLIQSQIDPKIRGEDLSLEELQRVASALHSIS